MHAVKLKIQDSVFEQFMGLIDILLKQSIQVEQIDDVSYYPNITHNEVCQKVKRSISNISNNLGQPVDKVYII